jgi:calcium-binding protein CML
MTSSSNGQDEFTLRNIFRNFDTNRDGTLSIRELNGLVSKLGVSMDEHELEALFSRLDLNENGCLEFEEFAKLLLEDPYK